MRKYIYKFQNSGSMPDPLSGDRNGVRTPRLGNYRKAKMKAEVAAAEEAEKTGIEMPENFSYTREQYRADLEANKTTRAKERLARKEARGIGNPLGFSDSSLKNMSSTATGLSMASNVAANFIDIDDDSNFQTQQSFGNALLASKNPYAQMAGAAFNTLSVLDQALGTNINTIKKNQAVDAGLSKGQRLLNNVLGFFPGNPIGAMAATKTDKAEQMTAEAAALSGGFGGAVNNISTASTMGNNRYLFGGSQINSFINKANYENRLLTDIGITNTQRKQSDYSSNLAQQNINRYAGNTYSSNRIGKHGFKLMSVSEIRQLLELRKEADIQAFQNGGVIGVDVNVIAEGKYHAHKNHLADVSEELADLTKKGIPVITHSDGGEIEQIAEIEKKELIFRLEVTKKLEELFEDGSEEAMIEAGKLVAIEIMENTQDNSGEVLTNE